MSEGSPSPFEGESSSDALPLPIQTFLWRQTSPFIRPKFGRQQISTAMEQREACKSLEKVLVQNIQFGLSPSLTEAITSVSRWRLIQAALPHVMHCTAALLYNRKLSNFDKLGAAETKLLYTLHWIILDAAEECSDLELEKGIRRPFDHYLLPITTLELFVYLFAPLTSYLKGSDFLSCFRLENGYKIWDAIFMSRHPDIPSFIAQAKPKKDIFSGQHFEKKSSPKFGDVFMGGSCDKDTGLPSTLTGGPTSPKDVSFPSPLPQEKEPLQASTERRPSRTTPDSIVPDKPKFSNNNNFKQLKDPLMATYFDVAVIRCLFVSQWIEEGVDWALKFINNRLTDIKGVHEKPEVTITRSSSLPNIKQEFRRRTTTYVDTDFEPMFSLGSSKSNGDEEDSSDMTRRRSFGAVSLPDPESGPSKKKSSKKKSKKESDDAESLKTSPSKKRKTDWKILRKALIFSSHELLPPRPGSSLGISSHTGDRSDDQKTGREGEPDSHKRGDGQEGKAELIRGKSMPSLHIWLERRSSSSDTTTKPLETDQQEDSDSSIALKKLGVPPVAPNPIITITEHSPVQSMQFFANQCSLDSGEGEAGTHRLSNRGMSKWKSDRNISYFTDTNPEAAGSTHCITKDGKLSLLTILKAVHAVSTRDSTTSLRACEGIIKSVRLLMELDILKKFDMGNMVTDEETQSKLRRNRQKEPDEFNVHNLMVDTLMSVVRHLGCPNGCSEGFHGPNADRIRKEIRELLLKLFQDNEGQFVSYFKTFVVKRPLQEVLDHFHAFLGFCTEVMSPLSLTKKHSIPASEACKTGYANNFGNGFGKIGNKGIEGVIVDRIFKSFVTRLVRINKELKMQENMSLYCELRQLISYVKDSHGGVFRKVMLSALFDSTEKLFADDLMKRLNKQQTPETEVRAAFIRESGEADDKRDSSSAGMANKKSFFRKKGSTAGIKSAQSNQSISDDLTEQWTISAAGAPLGLVVSQTSTSLLRVNRSASPRLSITDEDVTGMKSRMGQGIPTPPSGHKFPFVNWLKGDKNHKQFAEAELSLENGSHPLLLDKVADRLDRRPSTLTPRGRGHMTFMKGARKKVEDQFSKFVRGKGKNKERSQDEHIEMSRRNSLEFYHPLREGEVITTKEARLVSLPLIKSGILRFSFLMESCSPGSLPDPPLLAAVLDLKAPVAARAAFYLECAHFVHSCNRGQWPTWMKMNIPIMRTPGTGKSLPSTRRGSVAHNLHRSAGRMFYQWAEAIGARLEDMDLKDTKTVLTNLDDSKKRILRQEDEEEDFLNEASVNPNGNDCPFALKLAATQVLLEITAFLRESHQYLPTRTSRTSISKPSDQRTSLEPRAITANRRWSMALSSLGFSQNSAHSLISLADQTHPQQIPNAPGERRISFVLHEADGEVNSIHSSQGSEVDRKHEKRLSQSNVCPSSMTSGQRPHLLRRGTGAGMQGSSGSFKRRSLKLKKGDRKNRHRSSTVDESDDVNPLNLGPASIMRRADSMRSRGRRVSGISERSDVSGGISGEESPGVLSDDGNIADFPIDTLNADDADIVKSFPWIKVILNLLNSLDFECQHQYFCQINCYRRQIRACRRLVRAMIKIYEPEQKDVDRIIKHFDEKEDLAKREKKLKKIITGTGPSSPIRRKISVGHNMDKVVDHASLHSSMTFINNIDVEAGHLMDESRNKACVPLNFKVKKDDPLPLKYIKNQVKDLFHNPLSLLLKSTLVLTPSYFLEQLVLSWEMLLENEQHLSSTAASAFIVAAVKCPDIASELLNKELQNQDVNVRTEAINKFYIIWKARYQCWPRMEEGAHLSFKVPPPAIEFTLPSPKIAQDTMPVADPPWMPTVKAKVEEVTISQEQTVQKSFVTATKTRRKQQIEMVHKAIEQEQEKMREEREQFRISAVPANMQASYEPALFHSVEEHDDMDDDVVNEKQSTPHAQVAQAMFPSCLCSASVVIINLLDDPTVSKSGSAVYEVAYKVIWHCLVEDTALFLRHFFEKLTKERQKETFQILRRLIRFMPRLPAQAAYTLYNYLIGFVMFNVRSPTEASQELVGATLSVLWLVVPSVHGLFLKDLKQILRKEQCDANLLITANVPSAKKIIVYGPDATGIPSQFAIQEDTQFYQILIDSMDFFSIDDSLLKEYYLVDAKTNEIHNLNAFVRDFYFFKRSQYPQLSLIRMNPSEAFERLQKQAFSLQFLELGKALMSLSIVKSNYLAIQRVLFLHEELMKLPSFPRKALEANFSLYKGVMGKGMLGMDTLHKIVWIRLVARMFEVTSSFFAQSSDIHLFVNVLNGALILHCEDAAVLRLCMATYLNVAHQFKNIFAINGYLLITPTILRIYSNHQSNGLLCRTIEFICKQFYIMHRKPFLLQMFGSAAPVLDTDTSSSLGDATRIQPAAFFKLLQSFGQYISDPLDILELVEVEKPLKALDFCYQMDPETITILDVISLCVTVVSYSADCMRSHQMLTILGSIIPLYMKHLQGVTMRKETPGGPRAELQTIHSLSVCIRTLVSNCEPLTRNFSGPQRTIDFKGSSVKNTKQGLNSPPIEIDDDSHSKYFPDSYTAPSRSKPVNDDDESEDIRMIFRRPRDTLLNLVSEFLTRSTARLADLSKKVPDLHSKGSSYELLDVKSHLRLAEVAHSLLKVAPNDPQTMGCRGLIRYMNEVLPTSEWRQEAMRPALIVILRRLDKMFNKIAKKNSMKQNTDWDAAKRLLKGVYLTFVRHPYIVHLPHLKSLINVCQTIVLGDMNAPIVISGDNLPAAAAAMNQYPPAGFSSVAVRLIAMQMLQMGESQTLEVVCAGNLTSEKTEVYLMDLIYPMAIRISGGLKDVPKFRLCDVTFILGVILHSLNPTTKASTKGGTGGAGSDSNSYANSPHQNSMHQIGFLGLKILLVCFDKLLGGEWHKIARCIRDMCAKGSGGITMWYFLDFVVTYRTPLFALLLPMIRCKVLERTSLTDEEYYYQQQIKQKLTGKRIPSCRCKGQLLMYLLREMNQLKENLIKIKLGTGVERKTTVGESIGHRLSFAFSNAFQASVGSKSVASPHSSTPIDANSPLEKSAPQTALSRGFSFRDKPTLPVRGVSVKIGKDANRKLFMRRTSYPYKEDDIPEGGQPSSGEATSHEHSSSEPKLFRRSTLLVKMRGSKRGTPASVSPVKDKSPEESSVTETINEGEESVFSGEDSESSKKPRLKRQKDRKTFRFRKGSKKRDRDSSSVTNEEENAASDETSRLLSEEDKPRTEGVIIDFDQKDI